jgi:cytochrome c oxidase cbb3-type subunit 1
MGNWSFWLITFGITLMGIDLTMLGLQQGYMWMSGVEWLDSINAVRPYWLVRTIAGMTMDTGMSLLVINLMLTLRAGPYVTTATPIPARGGLARGVAR